jgi:hypothetical protein
LCSFNQWKKAKARAETTRFPHGKPLPDRGGSATPEKLNMNNGLGRVISAEAAVS